MKRSMIWVALFALATGLVIDDSSAQERRRRNRAEPKGYKIGDTVKDFALPQLSGQETSLSKLAKDKKYVVLDFWSITCPYCVGSEATYVKLNANYADKGVQFIHINSNRTENASAEGIEKMKKTAKKDGIKFPILIDKGNKVADAFGAPCTPTVFIIDPADMKILYRGAPNDSPAKASKMKTDYIDDFLKAKLAGQEPKVTSTKPVG